MRVNLAVLRGFKVEPDLTKEKISSLGTRLAIEGTIEAWAENPTEIAESVVYEMMDRYVAESTPRRPRRRSGSCGPSCRTTRLGRRSNISWRA